MNSQDLDSCEDVLALARSVGLAGYKAAASAPPLPAIEERGAEAVEVNQKEGPAGTIKGSSAGEPDAIFGLIQAAGLAGYDPEKLRAAQSAASER